MSTRETIVKMMQDAGYDTISACEHTATMLREFKESGESQATYHIKGGQSFTIKRN